MTDDFILQTEDLTKEFAGFVAVSGVNLRVARGTIHALIGPNGAGKTTCFNLLTKFLSPTRGRISFATAMVLYILAKLAEVLDHEIANAFGFVTGHTLKHLIATAATAAIVWGLTRRFSHDGHAARRVD